MATDLIIYLIFWIPAPLVFFYLAWRGSKSGSFKKVPTWYHGGFKWVSSTENVPMRKNGYFTFGILWLILGLIMFFIVGSDRFDLWFPALYK